MDRKSRISIVNFSNYIQVKGGGKAGNGKKKIFDDVFNI